MNSATIATNRESAPPVPACKNRCAACKLHDFCETSEAAGTLHGSDGLISSRINVKRGEALFRAGDGFHSLYAVHSGFFKTYAVTEDGRDQINGFHMSGELIGMDGIESDHHGNFAVALEDSQVCVISFQALERLCGTVPSLQRHFYRLMGHEIVRNQELALLLGSRRAEEKVAAFMLNLSQRFAERGYAAAEFHLRMTREEIGSYLGLTLETVSRVFSKFQESGLFQVRNKHIRGLDIAGMAAAVNDAAMLAHRTPVPWRQAARASARVALQ